MAWHHYLQPTLDITAYTRLGTPARVSNYPFRSGRSACLTTDTSYITSCGNQGCPRDHGGSHFFYDPQGTSITKFYGSIPCVWRSYHIRHLVLPIFHSVPPPSSSTTYPHGGNQLLPPSPISAPSRFSLFNHVWSSSGHLTHAVHLRVLPPPH